METGHFEDLDVGGSLILKSILMESFGGVPQVNLSGWWIETLGRAFSQLTYGFHKMR